MAFIAQDTNELGTPFPTDWMVMTIIRSTIQHSTVNNTVRGLVTCRWHDHEIELVPDPTATPEANTSESSLVRLAVGSEIQVRGLINVRAHFQGQGSHRNRKPILTMIFDVTQIRLNGDRGDDSPSPSPSPRSEGGFGGDEHPPRSTPPLEDGSRFGSRRPRESTEDEPEGGGGERGGRWSDPKRPRSWSRGGSSHGSSGPQGSSTGGGGGPPVPSPSHAQPTPFASSAIPGGRGAVLGGLGMSIVTAVAPASPICPLNLDTDFCIQTHYFDGYGRQLNADGIAQEQMQTLFTFRQNRASGNAHWLHVLATRQLEERQLNLAVWEEIIFPNPANTSETNTGPRRGTLQLIHADRRILRGHLPEEPSDTCGTNPHYYSGLSWRARRCQICMRCDGRSGRSATTLCV
ncbi:hypothetical protein BGZ82_001045 [Podila clonocystis]|nr:hypothetical protein BGZ82_001045 [Podila clonocystis]